MFDVPQFPCWRYWATGEARLVQSPEDLEALPPGHVPWPGVFPQPWPPPPRPAGVVDAEPGPEILSMDELPDVAARSRRRRR